jgi:hypothetical protein
MQVNILKYVNNKFSVMEGEDFNLYKEDSGGYAGASLLPNIASFDESELDMYTDIAVWADTNYSYSIPDLQVYKCYNKKFWVPLQQLASNIVD